MKAIVKVNLSIHLEDFEGTAPEKMTEADRAMLDAARRANAHPILVHLAGIGEVTDRASGERLAKSLQGHVERALEMLSVKHGVPASPPNGANGHP